MRIRTLAAVPAALVVITAMLTGCTAAQPSPEPTGETPAASVEPTVEPAAEVPDLRAICEDMIPLATIQERFGDDTTLLIDHGPSPEPEFSTWAALASGDVLCFWGNPDKQTIDANVSLMLFPNATDEYTRDREWNEEHEAEFGDSTDRRFDAFGTSIDECFEHRCDSSILLDDGSTWVTLQLQADRDSSLLDGTAMRERWDPVLEAVIASAPAALGEAPDVRSAQPSCDQLLSLEEASELLGETVTRVSDPRGWLEGGTVVNEKWHPAFHGTGCRWGDELESPSAHVSFIAAPAWARESSFERVGAEESGERVYPYSGRAIDVEGASDAWEYCIQVDDQVRGCDIDLLVGEFWLQVAGFDAPSTSAIAAAVAANLQR